MRPTRSLLIPVLAVAVAAPAMLAAPPAHAQNFFERLFGIRPERPPVPPRGAPRFEAAGGECPLRFDVVEGGVLVSSLGAGPICTFPAADCATTPVGLWGPSAATLIPRAGEFDTARGVADKAVRDNYKLM